MTTSIKRTALGVDYASVDKSKPPDFARMKRVGVEFAIVRGTYGISKDSTLLRDWKRLGDAGIVRGAYLFPVMQKKKTREPEPQIAAFVQALSAVGGLQKGVDLPPTLDVEFPKGIAATGMTRLECLDWVHRALTGLEDAFGCLPMIYTSARVWDGQDEDSLDASRVPVAGISDCPLWLARYPFKSKIPAHCTQDERDGLVCPPAPRQLGDTTDVWIHQYQGDAVGLPGFSSTIDLNRFFHIQRETAKISDRVKWVQRKLKVKADGDWGDITDSALREFQSLRKLPGNGIVDIKTFCALSWA